MKKIIGIILMGTVILSSSVFAIDGRIDRETKSDTSAGGGSPYVPIPVGMAINEKGLPGSSHSCPKGCRWNRWVNDCRCAQGVNRIMNIPGTNPVGGIVPVIQDINELCGTPPSKSKEDVYVRKIQTKGGLKSDFSIGEPGFQVEMIPSDAGENVLAKDRNPNSVKCACGTDVRGKDEAACGRICDFLKNNTNKSVCSTVVDHEVKSPRDIATGLATGKRQHKPLIITKEIDKSIPLARALQSVPGYECDVPEGWDNFTYPLLTGIKCELKEMPVDDDITLELGLVSPRDPASGLPTGKRMGSDAQTNAGTDLYTGPCRPPYLCIELSVEKRKGWDGTIKGNANYRSEESTRKGWDGTIKGNANYRSGESMSKGRDGSVKGNIEESSIVSPRDSASGLPTGKRQHKPITIRVGTNDQDCDDRDDDCDGMIVIEADLDGDGEREVLSSLPSGDTIAGKTKPKDTSVSKKEYVGHVTLNR